jgi:hypothetical protein
LRLASVIERGRVISLQRNHGKENGAANFFPAPSKV